MMRVVKTLFIAIIFAMGTGTALAGNAMTKSADEFAKSLVDLDYNTIVKYSHPSLVKAYGGKDKLAALLKKSYAELGMRFNKMTFSKKPYDKKRYGKIGLFTLPYTASISTSDGMMDVSSYYYVFTGPKEKAWFFLDCGTDAEKLLTALVPGYDGKLKQPKEC